MAAAVTMQTQGHIDVVLTNIAVAFSQNGGFIADSLFPVVNVKKESDVYYIYGRERFRSVNTKRQRGGEFNTWSFGISNATYTCDEDALGGFVDDRDYENFDDPIDPEGDLVEGVTEVLQLGFEKEAADLCRATGSYPDATHYNNPTAVFDTGGSSITMQADIQTLNDVIRGKIGRWANTMVVPPQVAYYMSMDDEIQDIVKHTFNTSGVANNDMLVRGPNESWLLPSTLWGLRVLVPLALEDTSKEKQTDYPTTDLTTSLTDVWGDDIWIGYVQPSPGIKKVSWGYTFEQRGWQTKRWRAEERESNAFRVTRISAKKVICSAAGALLQNCLSTI
jgi:hypothetical protein